MDINVVLVPTCLGVRRSGTEYGPQILIEELSQRFAVKKKSMIEINNQERFMSQIENNKENVALINDAIAQEIKIVYKNKNVFPIIIGGDHSLSIGSVAGICSITSWDKTLVIWLDAHGDLNTYETTPSNNIHGMSAAVLIGEGDERLKKVDGLLTKLPSSNLFLIGVRSLDEGETKLIEKERIKTIKADEFRTNKVYTEIENHLNKVIKNNEIEHIHLSFDLDSLDPSIFNTVSTPVDDGLTLEAIAKTILIIKNTGLLKSMDIVEFNPKVGELKKSLNSLNSLFEMLERGLKQ